MYLKRRLSEVKLYIFLKRVKIHTPCNMEKIIIETNGEYNESG